MTKKNEPIGPSEKLHRRAEDHNYDDSPSKLRTIIRSKNCDLGTALLAYWRGDPNYYRLFPNRWAMKEDAAADVAMFDLLVEIEKRVLEGRYSNSEICFDPFNDVGRTNWAENHYEFDWDEFHCDLPIEMYGQSTVKQLRSVRPSSDRPVGLSFVANAERDDIGAKTEAAINEMEKHNREGSYAGVNTVEEDHPFRIPGMHVDFSNQRVPDRIFENLKSIPGIVSLAFGEKSSDSVLKYLKYAPDLQELTLSGTFTSRGMANLKHVEKLKGLEVCDEAKQSNGQWLQSLSHLPNLLHLSLLGREFVKLTLDSFAKLTKLEELTMLCKFPEDADFRPLQKLRLRLVTLGGPKTTDAHIDSILQLTKLKKLKLISFVDSHFSDNGLEVLRKAFKKKLVE